MLPTVDLIMFHVFLDEISIPQGENHYRTGQHGRYGHNGANLVELHWKIEMWC